MPGGVHVSIPYAGSAFFKWMDKRVTCTAVGLISLVIQVVMNRYPSMTIDFKGCWFGSSSRRRSPPSHVDDNEAGRRGNPAHGCAGKRLAGVGLVALFLRVTL